MSDRTIRSVKGTRDLLPPETSLWAAVERAARRIFGLYGYGEIRTPVLESTDLFVRSVGESTDIVGKEMFTFADRKGRSLTLRPESTAAVARAAVQHRLVAGPLPLRLYYIGPHFRYERPQKGRYRQFRQIGAELVGDPGPTSDVEVVLMLVRFLEALGFSDLEVLLNTVGDGESRTAYREVLTRFLEPLAPQLGEDSRRRLASNPLRILDTKIPSERELIAAAPSLVDSLNRESREHFDAVCSGLDRFGVSFRIEPRLVRGLDYYTRTVFEITAAGLGSQDAIVGGGRYDGLIESLGGPALPGIGFAIGEDRLIETLGDGFRAARTAPEVGAVVAVGDVPADEALALAEELREQGVGVGADLSGRSLKAAMKAADRRRAPFVVLLGEDELAAGEVTVKRLASGEQQRLARRDLARALAAEEEIE